jgi:hypothetical protein
MVTAFTGFDGVNWPRLIIQAGFGGTLGNAPNALVLGVGPGLGTAVLGGTSWVDITADVESISIQRGRGSDTESADIGTCALVLDNTSGSYDPLNPDSPYVGKNMMTTNQSSYESGATTGISALYNCSIAASQAQALHGSWSLRLTSSAGGDMGARTPTGTAGIPVRGGVFYTVMTHARANTSGRTVRAHADWYDAAGGYISTSSDDVTPTDNGWVQARSVDPSPSNAAFAAAVVEVLGTGGAGEIHYFDQVGVVEGVTTVWKPGGDIGSLDIGAPIWVRAEYGGAVYDRFYGELADIELDLGYRPTARFTCADGLEKLGRVRIAETVPQFDGDKTGTRIGHLADEADWPTSLRSIDPGYTALGPTTLGDNALPLMRKVEQTELGLLFVDASGRLVFYDRYRTTIATRSTTVQASFSDAGGASDIEMTSLSMSKSRERIFNDVHVLRDAFGEGDEPVEQVATDPQSVAAYGTLSLSGIGELVRSDADAAAMAQGVLARFKYAQIRIRDVQIEAIAQNKWATILPLTLLDRISVTRDYGPNTVTSELLIQGVAEEIEAQPIPRWDFTFSTANPTLTSTLFLLGTGQLGVTPMGW